MTRWLVWLLLLSGLAWAENQGTAVADFNADGLNDIVLIQGKNLLFFGGTGGGYRAPQKWGEGHSFGPKARAEVVDWGADGRPDLLVLGPETTLWRNGSELCWTAPSGWSAAAVGPFGLAGLHQRTLEFYSLTGDTPVLQRSLELPEEGWSLCQQDFDGDRRPDLVIGAVGCQDVLLVTSRDDYARTRRRPMGAPVGRVVAGDFDRDGKPDLISVLEPEVRARPHRGKEVVYPVEAVSAYDAVRGDFNGDGIWDVAVLERFGLRIFPGLRKWLLGTAEYPKDFEKPDAVSGGDLDRDGKLDLVLSYEYQDFLTLLYNRGKPGLRSVRLQFP